MKFVKPFALGAALVFSTIEVAAAAPVGTLDQSTTGPTLGTTVIGRGQTTNQAVTVGIAGQLSEIELFIFREASTVDDLSLTIADYDDASPGVLGATLADITVALADVPLGDQGFAGNQTLSFILDLSEENLVFGVGDQFAISAFSPNTAANADYNWTVDTSYDGGSRFTFNDPQQPVFSSIPAKFATFVDTSATTVPLPAGLVLMLSGLIGLGALRFRRTA